MSLFDEFIPTEDVIGGLVSPVSGNVGSVYGDPRDGGARKHRGVDYSAPAGSEYVAPADLEYVRGGTGGTNLRNNDKWAHFRVIGTPYEYRVAHIGELPKPGTVFKQGETVGTIGGVINSPHLHAAFYNSKTGQYEDMGSMFKLKRGHTLTAGQPLLDLERRMEAVAGSGPGMFDEFVPQEEVSQSGMFDEFIPQALPTAKPAGNQWARENPEAAAMAGAPEAVLAQEPLPIGELAIGAKLGLVDLAQKGARAIDPNAAAAAMGYPITEEVYIPSKDGGYAKVAGDLLMKELFPQGVPKARTLEAQVIRGLAESWPGLMALSALAPVGAPAAFGLWGLTEEEPIKGAAKGVALGGVLKGMHLAASDINEPVTQWFSRIIGGMGIGGGATAAAGGKPEEVSRDALIFGLFEAFGMPRTREKSASWFEQKGVGPEDIKTVQTADIYSPEFAGAVNRMGEKLALPYPPGLGETFEMRPHPTDIIHRPKQAPVWETGKYPEVWINEKGRVEMSPETFQRRMEAAQGFAMRSGEPTGNLPATIPSGERGLVPVAKSTPETPPVPQVEPKTEPKATGQVEEGKGVEGAPRELKSLIAEAKIAKSQKEFVDKFTQDNLVDLSSPETHRWGRAFDNEPTVRDLRKNPEYKSYLEDIGYSRQTYPVEYEKISGYGGITKIYRAVPIDVKGNIQIGDYVSLDRKYAKEHGESNLSGKYRIISKSVPKSDIMWGGVDWSEWVYSPKKIRDYASSLEALYDKVNVKPPPPLEVKSAEGPVIPQTTPVEPAPAPKPEVERKEESSPAIQQALADWNSEKAYVDGNGNYHIKTEGKVSGPIAPWNKEVKRAFADTGEFHKAAKAEKTIELPPAVLQARDALAKEKGVAPEKLDYIGDQEGVGPMFNIMDPEHPGYKSTVSAPRVEGKTPKPSLLGDETGAVKKKIKPKPSELGAVGPDLGVKTKISTTPESAKVESTYEAAEAELKELKSVKFKRLLERAKVLTVDTSANLKKDLLEKAGDEGKRIIMRLDLTRGASSKANAIIEDGFKKVYKGLTPVDETILNKALRANRDLTILNYNPDHRVTGNLTPKELQAYLDDVPPRIMEKVKEYSRIMEDNLKSMREEGLISEKGYKNLLEIGDYLKTKYIQHLDPDRMGFDSRGRKITVPDSGIKKLDAGSEQAAEMNSRLLMAEVIGRTQGRIFRNRASNALYEYVKANPDNPFGFKFAKVYKETKGKKNTVEEMAWEDVPNDYDMTEVKPEQKVTYRWDVPTGHTEVSVMKDGKRIRMVLPDKYAREWIQSDPMMSHQLATFIGWASGSKILKTFATGMNPGFALTNLPRDIAHIWLVTEGYSKFAPKFMGQMGKDIATVAKDAITRKGRYRNYIDEGGGMNFLTNQGQLNVGGYAPLATLQKVLGYIGETSEIITRLAVRERAIKNGATAEEATWIARNYLDFAQGGSLAKAVDSGIPYLTASIQGTRAIVNAAKRNPADFIMKVGQIGALATGLYIANTIFNKDAWDQVPEKEKVTNWIITTPFDYRDKDGNKRYLYFRIAKDQGQRVFASLFEGLMGLGMGHDVNGDQVSSALKDFLPIVPTEKLPPTFMALLGYSANKDFWRNRDVWRGPKVEDRKEITKWTHPALKEAGEWTGLSPERLGYALSQFVPPTNTYAALVGAGFRKLMEDVPEKDREKVWQEMLQGIPMMNKVFRSTDPYEKFKKPIEKAKVDENTRRYEQRMEVDKIIDEVSEKKPNEKMKAYYDYVRKQKPEDRGRLMKEFKEKEKYYGIPDRNWWLSLRHMPPESRASVYYDRVKDMSPEESRKFEMQRHKLPGISSNGFDQALYRLKRQKSMGQSDGR